MITSCVGCCACEHVIAQLSVQIAVIARGMSAAHVAIPVQAEQANVGVVCRVQGIVVSVAEHAVWPGICGAAAGGQPELDQRPAEQVCQHQARAS